MVGDRVDLIQAMEWMFLAHSKHNVLQDLLIGRQVNCIGLRKTSGNLMLEMWMYRMEY